MDVYYLGLSDDQCQDDATHELNFLVDALGRDAMKIDSWIHEICDGIKDAHVTSTQRWKSIALAPAVSARSELSR